MPHEAISVDEFGSTGDTLMSAFHGLSVGNGRRPSSDAPPVVGFEVDPGFATPGSLAALQAARQRHEMRIIGRMRQHAIACDAWAVPAITIALSRVRQETWPTSVPPPRGSIVREG